MLQHEFSNYNLEINRIYWVKMIKNKSKLTYLKASLLLILSLFLFIFIVTILSYLEYDRKIYPYILTVHFQVSAFLGGKYILTDIEYFHAVTQYKCITLHFTCSLTFFR